MYNIKLVRLDFRLIHGQVIAKWFGQIMGNEIVIIDDDLSQDSFMASIYEMSAPVDSKVHVYSVEDAVKKVEDGTFASGKVLVLFKNVDQVFKAVEKGFKIDELQIGGLGSAPGRINVYGPITLDDHDASLLKKIADQGTNIYLQQVPEEAKMTFSKVLEKFDFNLE
ncbi:PTS mannose/fructose/sorbose transporter subunit IIB [Firmicutes bacterium AM41-11]|nr:PTS mannose/fructose/sorbose transporter subunit IIB [Firmicutes bacterium AM41-11]